MSPSTPIQQTQLQEYLHMNISEAIDKPAFIQIVKKKQNAVVYWLCGLIAAHWSVLDLYLQGSKPIKP